MPSHLSRIAAIGLGIVIGTTTAAAQNLLTDDPVIGRMWEEGMERSQTERLAQVLMDSIGPRLSGTPNFQSAVDWLLQTYERWGVVARPEQYGTWKGWHQGILHVDLIQPRIQTLEAKLLAWSPGTGGPVEAEVVVIPEFESLSGARAWLPTVRGKFVLASAPEITCREPQALRELAREETVEQLRNEWLALRWSWLRRLSALGGSQDSHRRLEEAGASWSA